MTAPKYWTVLLIMLLGLLKMRFLSFTFFRKEERDLLKRIKNGPLSAGVDFPRPVKKATAHSGNYVILYTYIPTEASMNHEVTQVNLDSILPTASGRFNLLVTDLVLADLDNEKE